MAKSPLPFGKLVKLDNNYKFLYFRKNHIKTTKIFSVRFSPDPPILKKIAVQSSPDPAKIGFSPDPVRSNPGPFSSLLHSRDDHYPVCRLHISRIVSLQPDKDIQKLLSKSNRIRIRVSETLLSIFRGFRFLEKVAHCTIIYLLSSEASFQPSASWLWVCLLSMV